MALVIMLVCILYSKFEAQYESLLFGSLGLHVYMHTRHDFILYRYKHTKTPHTCSLSSTMRGSVLKAIKICASLYNISGRAQPSRWAAVHCMEELLSTHKSMGEPTVVSCPGEIGNRQLGMSL